MKNLIVNVSRKTRMVSLPEEFISVDGENLQSNLVFRFTDEFVDGQARLEYKSGGTKNYIVLTENNEEYSTPVKNVITKEGRIEMQLVITEGTDPEEIPVFKSNVFYLYCNRSINAVNEAPEGYDLWIEIANEKLNEMDNIDIDIQTVGDNTEVIITRKDGTTKEAIVSGGGAVTDVQKNGTSVVVNGVANVTVPTSTSQLTNNSNFVSDSNYVHTDNNYTTNEKTKLANLSNYDDTEIRELIDEKQDTLIAGQNITIENNVISSTGGGGTGDVADVYYDDASVLDNDKIAQLYSEIYVGSTAPTKSQKIWIDTTESDVALKDLQDDTTHRLVTDAEKDTWNNKSNFSGDYDDLTNKPTIPTVPTNVSAFTNDAGYLTSHQDISGKLDTSKVKSTTSTTAGDVYDVTYINTMLGDIESLLGGI